MFNRWKVLSALSSDNGAIKFPAAISPLIKRFLLARGMESEQEATAYLETSLHNLHDVALLPNVDKAARRMVEAVNRGEKIAIYGDYDVDGITATAILYHALKTAAAEAQVVTYVPHRISEGYGINTEAIEQLIDEVGADLIISVDCGITAFEPALCARDKGVDLIITDHHNPPQAGEELPEAYAVVHPGLPDSEYPYRDLCGAGVAFKLAWRFATAWCGSERVTPPFRKILTQLLALAALGTIADVVPLTGENRIIARHGLNMMRHTDFVGLNALIEVSGLANESKIDSVDVGFRLAPRLNACGRMGHAEDAVRLFTNVTAEDAPRIAVELNRMNVERKAAERLIYDQACTMAKEAGMTDNNDCRIIILAHNDWHTGVVGIVCSRLVSHFGRPVILMQRDLEAGMIKGSARSIAGYSIHAGLEAVSGYLHTYGGHDMAAGLTVLPENYDDFVKALTAHAKSQIELEQLTPELLIDCATTFRELDESTVYKLLDLGPFGQGNARPLFLLPGLRIYAKPRQMGSEGKHLSITCSSLNNTDSSQKLMRFVGWSMGHLADKLAAGVKLDLAFHPTINNWQGRTSIEGEIVDLRLI